MDNDVDAETPANEAEYPPPSSEVAGLTFPIMQHSLLAAASGRGGFDGATSDGATAVLRRGGAATNVARRSEPVNLSSRDREGADISRF